MNELEKSTAKKLKELYGIRVEEADHLFYKRIVKIPVDAQVGLKGWSMIDSLIYEGEKGKRKPVGLWIRTSDL